MPREAFEIDETAFPVVLVTVYRDPTFEEWEQFFAGYERVLARNEPFVNVTDVSRVKDRPTATVRKRIAEWSKSIDSRAIRLSKGDARIVSNALVRGAMTAIGWLHPSAVKQQWFSDREAAIAWALERLDEARVPVPETVRRRLQPRNAL